MFLGTIPLIACKTVARILFVILNHQPVAAQECQVPIHRDERLANTLQRLEIGDFIPPELYEVVAQVLMFFFSSGSCAVTTARPFSPLFPSI